MWLAIVFACVDQGDGQLRPDGPTNSTTDGEVPDPDPGTDGPAPCAVDPALTVVDVTTSRPWNEHEVAVTVELSAAAAVAVRCTATDDPTEVHLVEGEDSATSHALRIAGLLGDTAYDCVAAAVCPQTSGPVAFVVDAAPLAPNLPEVEIRTFGDTAGSDYVLFNHSRDCEWESQRLIVMDRDGRVRWWYHTPAWVGPSVEFRYHGDNQFAWGGGWGPNDRGRPRTVDLFTGEVWDSAVAIPDVEDGQFHHDGKQLPDGRLLTLEQVRVEGDEAFDGFRVRRVDPVTGTVDFDYHSQRALDEGHLPEGSGDAWHANWADIVDETLYVSLCEARRVVAIDVATGDWQWTFGFAGGDFSLTDADGSPLDDLGFPSCQHGLEYRDDHLLVYDNGVGRDQSRVAEYALDVGARTAQRLWTWSEPDWYETTLGDADWLANGHVFVAAGHSECFSSNRGDHTTLWEIDPVAGEKVWELQYTSVEETAYRADTADACTLFANARYCPAVADRVAALAPVFEP